MLTIDFVKDRKCGLRVWSLRFSVQGSVNPRMVFIHHVVDLGNLALECCKLGSSLGFKTFCSIGFRVRFRV